MLSQLRSFLLLCLTLDVLGLNECSDVSEADLQQGTTESATDDILSTTLSEDGTATFRESFKKIGFRSLASDDEEEIAEDTGTAAVDAENVAAPAHPDDVVFRKLTPSGASSCTTPNREIGSCMPISQCKYLHNLLVYKIGQPGVPSLLRRSQCGDRNSAARYVCCPISTNSQSRTFKPNVPKQSGQVSNYLQSAPSKLSKMPTRCGNRSLTVTKVVGGNESEWGAWPWMVALFCSDSKQSKFQCGGSLISDQWVLTAGHCFPCTNTALTVSYVQLGDLYIEESADGHNAKRVTVPIKQIIRHPKYRLSPIQNDIALIRLARPVQFTSFIYPVCLLSGEQFKSDEYFVKNRLPYVAGWGSTEYGSPSSPRLMEGNVPVVSAIQCEKNYRNHKTQAIIDKRVICAGDESHDSCTGDSGGPLMFINANTGIVYQGGVVSFGVRCAEKNFPGVYTKVPAFIEWINNSTGLSF